MAVADMTAFAVLLGRAGCRSCRIVQQAPMGGQLPCLPEIEVYGRDDDDGGCHYCGNLGCVHGGDRWGKRRVGVRVGVGCWRLPFLPQWGYSSVRAAQSSPFVAVIALWLTLRRG